MVYSFLEAKFIQKRRGWGKLDFSRFRRWTTEQREGVSLPEVYVLWFSSDIHYLLKGMVDARPYPCCATGSILLSATQTAASQYGEQYEQPPTIHPQPLPRVP
ncbi:hypothetical protein ECTW00353_5105 [Escherichia coli TW00353]|nr:hypothetical protein ECTW00353_5105 [Escherichia coli TW00353]